MTMRKKSVFFRVLYILSKYSEKWENFFFFPFMSYFVHSTKNLTKQVVQKWHDGKQGVYVIFGEIFTGAKEEMQE